jgi:hypothetical protein
MWLGLAARRGLELETARGGKISILEAGRDTKQEEPCVVAGRGLRQKKGRIIEKINSKQEEARARIRKRLMQIRWQRKARSKKSSRRRKSEGSGWKWQGLDRA